LLLTLNLFSISYFCLYRYPSDVIENCRTSEDRNNTSSTLRQEAISITKVRCKQRNTWIRSSTSFENNSTNILSNNLGKKKEK
jgi:hypothetical protein